MYDHEKIAKIADSITDEEYTKYRDFFLAILINLGSKGFTALEHLKKIPNPSVPGEFLYEFKLSDAFTEFLTFMESEFQGKNQDIKAAITLKVIDELVIKPMYGENEDRSSR